MFQPHQMFQRRRLTRILLIPVFAFTATTNAQTTSPADDAAALYARADKMLSANNDKNIYPPSSSNLAVAPYPPFPAAWQEMERVDFAANAPARALAHQASASVLYHFAQAMDHDGNDAGYSMCRNLANELSDAALYQHLQHDDPGASQTLQDEWHLANLLEAPYSTSITDLLVGIGIRDENLDRLEVIVSGAKMTNDPTNTTDLQIKVARDWIAQLLNCPEASPTLGEYVDAKSIAPKTHDRIVDAVKRMNAERGMAALSLACHLYRFEHGTWPKSLADLHGYLPATPIDPFGNGAQTLRYALIRAGLPDGTDRPLVYSRCGAQSGLFYRTDQPFYSFYTGDGPTLSLDKQKNGGQFRDVASWSPPTNASTAPTTQALP